MPGPQPKGRGAPQQPPPKKVQPRRGGPGVLKDTKCTIQVLAAPKGSTKMLRVLLRGYATHGLSAAEDGTTFAFSLERRKAREVLFKVRKLWNAEQISVQFAQNGNDVTEAVEAEAPPQPIQNETQQNRTQAMLQRARAVREEAAGEPAKPAQKTPGQAPDQQAWGWKNGARDVPPPAPTDAAAVKMAGLDYSVAEGVHGVWAFGNGYRPVDADKLDAEAKKRLAFRDGKQKISLGVNSERKYMIEPDRTRGGWTATRLTEEFGAREFLGNAEVYRDAVAFVQVFEEKRATPTHTSAAAPVAPVAAAPVATPVVAPTPIPTPASVATASTPVSAPAPAGGFAMGLLTPAPNARWKIEHNGKVLAYGDNLEAVMRAARAAAGDPPMFVMGWNGQIAAAPAQPAVIEIEVDGGQGLQLTANDRQRLAEALRRQQEGDDDEDEDYEDEDDEMGDLDDQDGLDDSAVAGGDDDAGDLAGGALDPAPQNQDGNG